MAKPSQFGEKSCLEPKLKEIHFKAKIWEYNFIEKWLEFQVYKKCEKQEQKIKLFKFAESFYGRFFIAGPPWKLQQMQFYSLVALKYLQIGLEVRKKVLELPKIQ